MGRPFFLFASALRDDQNQHQQQPHHSQPLNAGPKTRQTCVRMRCHVIVVILLLLAILVTAYQLIATSLTISNSSINSQYVYENDRPNVMAYFNLPQQQQQEQRQQNQSEPQNETGNARKDEPENRPNAPQQDEAFSACLLVMDDNHYLIEWLAYHYYKLPLRRLIVAIDPRSKTSPLSILQRYGRDGRMNVTIWRDDDFFPRMHRAILMSGMRPTTTLKTNDTFSTSYKNSISSNDTSQRRKNDTTTMTAAQWNNKKLVDMHRARQRHFYARCMKQLQEENRTWTALIDTDEYIVPHYDNLRNYYVDRNYVTRLVRWAWQHLHAGFNAWRVGTKASAIHTSERQEMSGYQPNQAGKQGRRNPTTILQLLQAVGHHASTTTNNHKLNDMMSSPCISLPRRFIGTKESTTFEVESTFSNPRIVSPPGWNATDFMTLRWRWHGGNEDSTGSRKPSNGMQSTATTISTKQRAGKAMIDISRVNSSFLNAIQVNPHRPIKAICSIENMWVSTQDALFLIHHYIGTYSQWSFRDDPRTQAWEQLSKSNKNETKDGSSTVANTDVFATTATRSRERYEAFSQLDAETVENAIREWLQDFVDEAGMDVARELLQGAGQVEFVT